MSETRVHYPSPAKVVRGTTGETEEPTDVPAGDRFEPSVRVARDHIVIGDVTLSGRWVERGSIVVRPGYAELNTDGRDLFEHARVTVTFVVGNIDVDEDAIGYVQLLQPLTQAIDIALAAPDPPDAGNRLQDELDKLDALHGDECATPTQIVAQAERVAKAHRESHGFTWFNRSAATDAVSGLD